MSVLGLWLGRAIGSWFGPVAQDQAQEEENEGTRGGRGYRGLLPYEEPFSADDLRKLNELHEARRQAQQVEQPKPAEKLSKAARKRLVAESDFVQPSTIAGQAQALDAALTRPGQAATVNQEAQLTVREQAKAADALALQAEEEEEEFAMVLMQVLLAA